MKTSIKFINHASVIVSADGISILSDPWYQGPAFNKGWNLLHETPNEEIISHLQHYAYMDIARAPRSLFNTFF